MVVELVLQSDPFAWVSLHPRAESGPSGYLSSRANTEICFLDLIGIRMISSDTVSQEGNLDEGERLEHLIDDLGPCHHQARRGCASAVSFQRCCIVAASPPNRIFSGTESGADNIICGIAWVE